MTPLASVPTLEKFALWKTALWRTPLISDGRLVDGMASRFLGLDLCQHLSTPSTKAVRVER